MDIVSMEFGSSTVQGTESCNLNEELTWNYGRANVVAQPIPFECSPAKCKYQKQFCIPGDIYIVETSSSAQACMQIINAIPNPIPPVNEHAPAI